jgi:hypothetical protein
MRLNEQCGGVRVALGPIRFALASLVAEEPGGEVGDEPETQQPADQHAKGVPDLSAAIGSPSALLT